MRLGRWRRRDVAVSVVSLCVLLSAPFTAGAAGSEALAHYWSMAPSGAGTVASGGVAIDANGSPIVVGSYTNTLTLGGPQLSSAGDDDLFIGKFSSAGAHQWSKTFGDAGPDIARAVAIDAGGNVLVAGQFEGTVNFGGSTLTSAGASDIFVAKFGPTGTHLFSAAFGSSGADIGYGIATGPNSSYVIVGAAGGPVDFGGGVRAHAGAADVFAAGFSSNGLHAWSITAGSAGSDEARAVTVGAAGATTLTGSFQQTINFGGSTLTSNGSSDVFLASFSSTGAHLASSAHGAGSFDAGYGVTTTSEGVLAVTGRFSGSIDFGTGTPATSGNTDAFVAVLPADPAARFVGAFGESGADIGRAIAADPDGNVVVTGTFENRIDFGAGPALTGAHDVFVARLDPTGDNLWARGFGGAETDDGRAVASDTAGHVALGGDFFNTIDLGGGALSSDGGGVYLARFGPDIAAPATTIATSNPALLLSTPAPTAVTGISSDAAAGIASVDVTFTPLVGTATVVQATLTCGTHSLSCTWEALPPAAGYYTVRAVATDKSGNVETPGPTITAIVI